MSYNDIHDWDEEESDKEKALSLRYAEASLYFLEERKREEKEYILLQERCKKEIIEQ